MQTKIRLLLKEQSDLCPKISYMKTVDKMAYANQDQTAPEGAVWSVSTLFAILLNI